MTNRRRLPNRHPNESMDFEFRGHTFTLTFSHYVGGEEDGRVAEFFARGAKIGSEMETMLNDYSSGSSISLQYAVPLGVLKRASNREPSGRASSVFGKILDILIAEERQRAETE